MFRKNYIMVIIPFILLLFLNCKGVGDLTKFEFETPGIAETYIIDGVYLSFEVYPGSPIFSYSG